MCLMKNRYSLETLVTLHSSQQGDGFWGACCLITRGRSRISFGFTEVESDTGSISFFPLVGFIPLLRLSFYPLSGENSTVCVSVCWCVILSFLTNLSVILCFLFVLLFIFLLSFLPFSTSVNASYLWCTPGSFGIFWILVCVYVCVCCITWLPPSPKESLFCPLLHGILPGATLLHSPWIWLWELQSLSCCHD